MTKNEFKMVKASDVKPGMVIGYARYRVVEARKVRRGIMIHAANGMCRLYPADQEIQIEQ
jgi:hypothetical protein